MPFAVITGATQGIGKAIAEKLLAEGFSIAVCARNEDDLKLAEKTWKEQYPTATVLTCRADMGKKEDVLAFATFVTGSFPEINILVNNAGTFQPGLLTEEVDGHLENMMQVNLYSAYHITRAVMPHIKKAKDPHIFNMCSVASLKAYPGGGSYGITKYALLGFSDNLREELKPHAIKVTAICPGATYSRSWEGSGFDENRMMEGSDIADMLWSAYKLSAKADVEKIVMRPIKGDL